MRGHRINVPFVPIPMNFRPPWRLIGNDHYTLVEPVEGPYVDPAILALIHEFDADALPIWRKQMWERDTGQRYVNTCIGIARFNPDPKRSKHEFRIELSQGYSGPKPNMLEFWWRLECQGAPDVALPFDHELVVAMREAYETRRAAEIITEVRETNAAAKAQALAAHERDAAARWRTANANIATVFRTNTFQDLLNQYMTPDSGRPFVLVGKHA